MVPSPVRRHPIPLPTTADLVVEVDVLTGRIVVAGGLHRRTAHRLVDAVRAMATTSQRRWILDVERLERCDAEGLAAISACYRRALRDRADLVVVGASEQLQAGLGALRLHSHVVPDGGTATSA